MRHLEVKLYPGGSGTVLLDGVPIHSYNRGIEIKSDVHQGTEVTLHLARGLTLDFAQAIESIRIEGDCPTCGKRITFNTK